MADFSYTVADGANVSELVKLKGDLMERIISEAEATGFMMLDGVQREVRAVHRLASGVQI